MLKKNVLRNKENFNNVYAKGSSLANKYLVMFYLENELEYNRVGFLASKKVGNSVKRNRARRLMKETYLLNKDQVKIGYDIIFIARNNIIHAEYKSVESAMNHILKKSNFLRR